MASGSTEHLYTVVVVEHIQYLLLQFIFYYNFSNSFRIDRAPVHSCPGFTYKVSSTAEIEDCGVFLQ